MQKCSLESVRAHYFKVEPRYLRSAERSEQESKAKARVSVLTPTAAPERRLERKKKGFVTRVLYRGVSRAVYGAPLPLLCAMGHVPTFANQ